MRGRWLAALLKAVGFVALACCLVEPLIHRSRPRPGANLFVVLADNSESLKVQDPATGKPRGAVVQDALRADAQWLDALGRDFDLRQYTFDEQLRSVDAYEALSYDGQLSSIVDSLKSIQSRYERRPLAGVLLFTDGVATDLDALTSLNFSGMPPIYPVMPGSLESLPDLSIGRVTVSETSFETTPVTIHAELGQSGFTGKEILAKLLDGEGAVVEETSLVAVEEEVLSVRFSTLR